KDVVFAASRNGALDRLYRRRVIGAGADELLSNVDGSTPSDWSPDGRFLLFYSNNNLDQGNIDQRNGFDIWLLSLADGRELDRAITQRTLEVCSSTFQKTFNKNQPRLQDAGCGVAVYLHRRFTRLVRTGGRAPCRRSLAGSRTRRIPPGRRSAEQIAGAAQ